MKIKMYMCGGETPDAEYPLGIGYLMAFCNGIEYVTDKQNLRDCDIIGLSCVGNGVREAVEIADSTNIPVIIGGQATLWEGLRDYNFKYIVKGEGELPLQDIINGNEPEKCQIKYLDCLPFPVFGKIKKTIPILTSRGCLFDCAFCSSTNFWGKVRYHSPEYIMDYLRYLDKKYPGVTDLYIHDDTFVSNKKRLTQIFELWMCNNFHKRFIPRGHVRSGVFDKDIAIMLKEMGFKTVRFGAESGSNRLLKVLNKNTTVENHQKIIDICNKIGLQVGACFMYDIPFETEEDRQLTREFMHRNKGKFKIQGWYKFRPFAGTKFYNNEDLMKVNMAVR